MNIGKLQKTGLALVLVTVAGVINANPITRDYGDNDRDNGSGSVTYESSGQTLTITFDNTSANIVSGTTSDTNSSIITGLVFDIDAVINGISSYSFSSSNGIGDLTSLYSIKFDTKSNIVKGSTKVDLEIATINGAIGGIYSAASSGDISGSVFPDLATLVLTIDDPASYSGLTSISGDILRMQRVGPDGEGSLKIPGFPPGEDPPAVIPEPGILSLLVLGLAGAGVFRRRQRASH